MERSLIMLIGTSGSGKTTLGKNIVEKLQPPMTIEHISTGNLIRHIGSGAVASAYSSEVVQHLNGDTPNRRLDENIMYTIISEALMRAEASDTILLDGAPRTKEQINVISELALKDGRSISGAILAYLENRETNIARLLKRRPRDSSGQFTYPTAVNQLDYSSAAVAIVTSELDTQGVRVRRIETSGAKQDTAQRGASIARYLINTTPSRST